MVVEFHQITAVANGLGSQTPFNDASALPSVDFVGTNFFSYSVV